MRLTHLTSGGRYVPGDRWAECARCGFEYLRSKLVQEARTGLMVCRVGCVDKAGYKDETIRTTDPQYSQPVDDTVKWVHKQADVTLDADDADGTWTFTNAGAISSITQTLPTLASGLVAMFERVSPFALIIAPEFGAMFDIAPGGQNISLDSDGATLVCTYSAASEWATTISGTYSLV